MGELTSNQQRFIAEYVASRNGVQAYIRAFSTPSHEPSYGSARVQASRLLTDANIRNEIDAAAQVHARACSVSAKRVLCELATVAFSDAGDFYEEDAVTGLPKPKRWSDISPGARRAIKSIRVKKRTIRATSDFVEEIEECEIRFHDKMKSLNLLFKHLGLGRGDDAINQLLAMLEGAGCGPPAGE